MMAGADHDPAFPLRLENIAWYEAAEGVFKPAELAGYHGAL